MRVLGERPLNEPPRTRSSRGWTWTGSLASSRGSSSTLTPRRRHPLTRPSLATTPIPALAAVLALAACGASVEPDVERPAGSERWNAVIVVLDALPADALGCYGYPRPVSPEVDRFAAEAVRFEEAYAAASYTLASTASLFTGLPPAAHGVVGLRSNLLAGGHHTVAEALGELGFRTAAFSCNPHVTEEGGFAQGFGHFRHYARDRFDRHAVPEALPGDVLAWWDDQAGGRRFLYVHLLPPHQPYDPPPPHEGLFGAAESPREEGMTDFLVELDRERGVAAADPLARRIRDRYDAGVHHADAVFGELLAALDERGAADDTLVILLSDHGEAFGEHGRLLHGSTVFREMTRVPLIARWPGCAPGVRPGLVRTRDLAATLTALFGAPWPADGRAGEPFLAELLGPVEPAPRLALSRSVGNLPVWALRSDRWTLVMQPSSGARQLFDRRSDPGELRDVADGHAREAGVLAERLAGLLKEHRALARRLRLEGGEVRAHRESLEALGYFGDE